MPYTWPPTLSEVKTDTNISETTDDAELQTMIDAATAMLENHPAYTVADHVKTTAYTEWHDGGTEIIVLKHYPFDPTTATITEYYGSISQALSYEPADGATFTTYGWTTQDGTGANGVLLRTSGGNPYSWCYTLTCHPYRPGRVKVAYTAGTSTVPADLHHAALLLVEHLWQTQRGTQASSPAGLDAVDQAGTFGAQYGPSYALPLRVLETLEPYRRTPVVA